MKYLIIMALFLTSCSTLKNKTLRNGLIGFAACSAVGASIAPENESEVLHGAFNGSVCSTAAMAGTELYNQYILKKDLKEKNRLKKERQAKPFLKVKEELLSSRNFSKLDKKTQELLKKDWDLFDVSNWVTDGDKLIHEDYHIIFKKD